MLRTLPLVLTALLLAPLLAAPAAAQPGTATPTVAGPLDDAEAVVAALDTASPPATLPGNTARGVTFITWSGYYGSQLAGVEAAWVLIGSNELPMATVLVFPAPENAQAGLTEYREDSARVEVDGLEAYTIADRGKWVCIAADGAVVIFGQAEPQGDEDTDTVRARACEVLTETRAWLLTDVMGLPATPRATPSA